MVDNMVPTNQFHPYQPADAIPQSEVRRSGLDNMLHRIGIDRSRLGSIRNTNFRQPIDKVRGYAQRNPAAVLGGIAAVAIGLGLMRGRT